MYLKLCKVDEKNYYPRIYNGQKHGGGGGVCTADEREMHGAILFEVEILADFIKKEFFSLN